MGTFKTQKTIIASPELIPEMSNLIISHFSKEGFETQNTNLPGGACQISISKGGLFKAALGLKTALNISLTPVNGNVYFDAGIGIFGKQVVPSMLTLFVAWPIIITQMWGLVQQSKLDDQALALAEDAARTASSGSSKGSTPNPSASAGRFCTSCGTPLTGNERFCPNCGKELPR